jgi:threonylcarbamoyladenosine tRNA methylthiotransferase MtaB
MMDYEYLKAIDDEICGDVYYYHNEVNDKVDLYTVGCEMSEWDGEKIAHMINPEELTDEIILVNTCAVTDFAQFGSEKLADRLSKIYPNKKIYFIGCGVNYNKDYYSKLGIALTNLEKFKLYNYGVTSKNENSYFKLNQHRDVGMVKIEDGCYNNCAYCIIHKIRPHYMMSYEKIHKQIRNLLNQGKKNIQLIGTEICSYKSDGLNLTTLCEKILADFPEISNLVLGALDPASKQIDTLIDLIKREKRIYNVLYLCTQSCSDEILRRMNRRHNVDRLREIHRLAGDDVHLVFQLILGFPGETDELFQETIDVIKELKPVDYDAIVFSARKGTPAYDMPDKVPTEVTDRRERIVYDLIKNYTFDDDQNTNRSFAQYEQTGSNNFVKYKPDLNNSIIFYEDLYNTDSVIRLFDRLNEYKNESKDVVIVTNFDLSKDLFDLDVNIKLLTSKFGVKVVTKFLIDDDVMDFISHTYWIPNVIMYRIGTYMEFDFKKLVKTTKEDIIKLFKTSYLYKIDDTDLMAMRLLKAGNHELFKIIVEHFEGSL